VALNETQIAQIRGMLQSSAWNEVMKPVIATRANAAIKALILTPAERTGEYKDMDDSAIRAQIREAEWLLAVFVNEVAVFDHNRRVDELQRQENPEAPSTANP
jgi:hypothetical protein